MLTQMRTLSQNWIGRSIMAVVLGFIIISFAVWGIGDRFNNFNSSELAKVGSTRISVDQYRQAYQNDLQQLQQKEKRGITNDEARRRGLDRQVLGQLLRDAVLDEEARKLGLAVSDATIAQTIMQDPSFKSATGQFDRMRFGALLQNNGLTETTYVRQQRGAILRQDVGEAVIAGLTIPKALEAQVHRYKAEVRDVDYFVLPASAAGTIPKPSDADLKTYYDEHASTFVAPEYRKLIVLSIVPANLVKPDKITDEDVKKRYEEMKNARFFVPEKRGVEQLVFPDAKAAEAAKAKLDGGESFDKLLAEQKKTAADVSLGTVTKSELADKAVADAAFALAKDATSKPIKTQFGTVLVHVSKIEPSREQPLIEVSAQLKDEVAIIRAKQQATQMRDKIEDARTAGKTLTEAAASVGLKPRTIDAIDAQGRDKAHKPVEGLVEGPTLLKNAFQSDVGADTEMIQAAGGGNVWYEISGTEPSHALPLDAVKPQVEAGWRNAETTKRLATESDKFVKAIDGGKSLEAVATDAGKQKVFKATNVSRGGAPSLPSEAVAPMFDVVTGKAGSTSTPDHGRIVFKVASASVPPVDPKDEDFTKLMDNVKNGLENDVLGQYLAEVQHEVGVAVNQGALQSALGGDAGS